MTLPLADLVILAVLLLMALVVFAQYKLERAEMETEDRRKRFDDSGKWDRTP